MTRQPKIIVSGAERTTTKDPGQTQRFAQQTGVYPTQKGLDMRNRSVAPLCRGIRGMLHMLAIALLLIASAPRNSHATVDAFANAQAQTDEANLSPDTRKELQDILASGNGNEVNRTMAVLSEADGLTMTHLETILEAVRAVEEDASIECSDAEWRRVLPDGHCKKTRRVYLIAAASTELKWSPPSRERLSAQRRLLKFIDEEVGLGNQRVGEACRTSLMFNVVFFDGRGFIEPLYPVSELAEKIATKFPSIDPEYRWIPESYLASIAAVGYWEHPKHVEVYEVASRYLSDSEMASLKSQTQRYAESTPLKIVGEASIFKMLEQPVSAVVEKVQAGGVMSPCARLVLGRKEREPGFWVDLANSLPELPWSRELGGYMRVLLEGPILPDAPDGKKKLVTKTVEKMSKYIDCAVLAEEYRSDFPVLMLVTMLTGRVGASLPAQRKTCEAFAEEEIVNALYPGLDAKAPRIRQSTADALGQISQWCPDMAVPIALKLHKALNADRYSRFRAIEKGEAEATKEDLIDPEGFVFMALSAAEKEAENANTSD